MYIREPLKEAYERICIERGEENEYMDLFLDSFFLSPYEDIDQKCWLHQLKKTSNITGGMPRNRYYLLCASETADNVNMWNYYVKDGAYRGYNLGLEVDVIESYFSNLTDNSIALVSGGVIYDRAMQVESFYTKIQELWARFDEHIAAKAEDADDAPIIDEFQDDLYNFIIEKKLFFKNPAFESEHEYRFVLKVREDFFGSKDMKYDFRVGASGIITPYIEWKFGNLKAKLLKQITLSPMIEPELARSSFQRFLAEDVYESININPSTIKLRY